MLRSISLTHPLAGARLKFSRGNDHAKAFYDELREFYKAHPSPIEELSDEFNPDSGEFLIKVKRVTATPPKWGPVIGDVVQNYRSALDYLAWELAKLSLAGSREPSRDTQFPIVEALDDRGRRELNRRLFDISEPYRGIVEKYQPHTGRHGTDALLRLQRLSNADKHRALVPSFVVFDSWQAEVRAIRDCIVLSSDPVGSGVPAVPDTKLVRVRVRVTGPNPQVELDGDISAFVGVEEARNISDAFREIAEIVDEILSEFQPLFPIPQQGTVTLP